MSIDNNINDLINDLPREKRISFGQELRNNLEDEQWCSLNEIDYVDPDVKSAKEKTYSELKQQAVI